MMNQQQLASVLAVQASGRNTHAVWCDLCGTTAKSNDSSSLITGDHTTVTEHDQLMDFYQKPASTRVYDDIST